MRIVHLSQRFVKLRYPHFTSAASPLVEITGVDAYFYSYQSLVFLRDSDGTESRLGPQVLLLGNWSNVQLPFSR